MLYSTVYQQLRFVDTKNSQLRVLCCFSLHKRLRHCKSSIIIQSGLGGVFRRCFFLTYTYIVASPVLLSLTSRSRSQQVAARYQAAPAALDKVLIFSCVSLPEFNLCIFYGTHEAVFCMLRNNKLFY